MLRLGFLTMAFVNKDMLPPRPGSEKSAPAIFTMAMRKIQPATAGRTRAWLFFARAVDR